ncbi:MAG: hypothetical protein AAGU27_22930 [Dehalobacterium sp.]
MHKENNEKNENIRACGVCTCIHCLNNTCALDECDMYFERKLIQEG